jgi:hypothetical protein
MPWTRLNVCKYHAKLLFFGIIINSVNLQDVRIKIEITATHAIEKESNIMYFFP